MAKKCTLSPMGVHYVESDSDSSKKYVVEIGDKDHHTCTCVAYAIDRNRKGGKVAANAWGSCKHIKRLVAGDGCGWDSETGPEVQKYPNVCPRCASDSEEFTPYTGTEDVNDILARLKELRDRAATA